MFHVSGDIPGAIIPHLKGFSTQEALFFALRALRLLLLLGRNLRRFLNRLCELQCIRSDEELLRDMLLKQLLQIGDRHGLSFKLDDAVYGGQLVCVLVERVDPHIVAVPFVMGDYGQELDILDLDLPRVRVLRNRHVFQPAQQVGSLFLSGDKITSAEEDGTAPARYACDFQR